MSDNVFDGQIFADKLSKLNSSQQSIESLSRLCISHRKKARQIVETWDKAFSTAQREQRVSFLYLANDILQNSRRKGSEFVNEFWKFLPTALKHVYDSGDENGKKAACRLVDIWEERKVFGSRGQNLKDEMLGKQPPLLGKQPPPSISNGKISNPIKIVKRDSHSLRIKLSVGGMPEKILTAFQSAHDENGTEETALNKCRAAASLVGKMEKEVEITSAQGNQQGSLLIDEIQDQENILEQCVSQLENAEASRGALVFQLKEAIQEQELKMELIRTQLHVARGNIAHLGNMKHMLTSPLVPASLAAATNQPTESPLMPSPHSTANNRLLQPVNSFASVKTSEEENKKAAAAAVAAKLTASTSSAQMLTSILSSLVAEEAASKSSALKSAGFTSSLPMFSPEKRPRLENPSPVTDVNSNSDMGSGAGYFTSLSSIQTNQMQSPFPPPPPPPVPSGSSPANQFVQPSGMMMGVMPYPYGATSLPPPPPPLPSHIAQALARPPLQPPLPQQPPPQQQQQQQQPMNGGYYRPPGIGFQGQTHQPTSSPPVPRQ